MTGQQFAVVQSARAFIAAEARAGEAIFANIALEVLRKRPSLPDPIQFVRGIDYAEIPPAHIAAAAMKETR